MKAICKTKPEAGFELLEVPSPKVTSQRVLVKVKATSICGSDVHLYHWDDWAQKMLKPPTVIGHECAGEIVEVGSQVDHLKVGDRVALESHIPCQECPRCRHQEMHLCDNLETIGFQRDGSFAEYIAMPEICCLRIGEKIDWETASIHEPLGNSVYAVSEGDVAGKTVAVFGDGPTGLFAVAVARHYGASKLFAVGASDYRLEIMKKLGPDLIIDARNQNVKEVLMEQTKAEGVDVVLEMSGAVSAIHDGLAGVRKGGTYIAFGIPSKTIELNMASQIILKGIKIVAIHGRKMFDSWNRMHQLFESGKFDISPVITHKMKLEDFQKAFDLLTAKPAAAGKIVLLP